MLQADHMVLLLWSIAAVPFYLPTVPLSSSLPVFSAPCLFPFVCMLVLLMIAVHTSERKVLNVVLICIFLVGKDVQSYIHIYKRVCMCERLCLSFMSVVIQLPGHRAT